MRSKRPLPLLLAALCLGLALPAGAQIYQWKDASGKTVISDKPPPGQLPVPKQNDSGDSAPAAQAEPAQPSLADRELEFRKRRKEAQENAEKAEKEDAAAAEKEANCRNVRQQLQTLESGDRIALRNDKGERYFMDDAQRAQEAAKARQYIDSQCQ
ncbi:MAG: DUF4124 domain-containing protein [Candidatus Accumulibacter sp.]|jgi:hypothetical protein|nr:DUF4124 domain-containing protein [Accumulibacter sp.]